jgi:hypothetical protein
VFRREALARLGLRLGGFQLMLQFSLMVSRLILSRSRRMVWPLPKQKSAGMPHKIPIVSIRRTPRTREQRPDER